MAGKGGGDRGGERERSYWSGGGLDLEGAATDFNSWDLLENGAKLRQLLQRDVAVLIKPGNEGGKDLKVDGFLFENPQKERLVEGDGGLGWGAVERVEMELLAH